MHEETKQKYPIIAHFTFLIQWSSSVSSLYVLLHFCMHLQNPICKAHISTPGMMLHIVAEMEKGMWKTFAACSRGTQSNWG